MYYYRMLTCIMCNQYSIPPHGSMYWLTRTNLPITEVSSSVIYFLKLFYCKYIIYNAFLSFYILELFTEVMEVRSTLVLLISLHI